MATQRMRKTYQQVRGENQDALRRSVLAAADELLTTEGAAAVTVRRVAQEIDSSTTVIYNLFGSKDGLANALYLEGCRLLYEALAQVATNTEPPVYLKNLGWAYWDFAQAHPNYYQLMFNGALPDFTPDKHSLADMATAIDLVIAALARFQLDGTLTVVDPAQAATATWAALHGVVHLAITGHFPDLAAARAVYDFTITTFVNGLLQHSE